MGEALWILAAHMVSAAMALAGWLAGDRHWGAR